MLFDESDNTVRICSGGVWVSLEDVAGQVDTEPQVSADEFIAWARENLNQYDEYLEQAIIDFVTEEIASLYEADA